MLTVKKITGLIDRVSDIIGRAAMYIAMLILFITIFEVVSRRFLNRPTLWTYETTTMLFGAFILFIMPYGMLHKVNVSVDIVTERLPEKSRRVLDFVTYLVFFFPFMIILFCGGFRFAASSWQILETSWSNWRPPLYPIKTCIPVAAFFTLLQGVSEMLKKLMAILELRGPAAPKEG